MYIDSIEFCIMNNNSKLKICIKTISHIINEKKYRRKWFDNKEEETKFIGLISCVDGRMQHGGMCDRFKGIVSTYCFCKMHSLPFRINYTCPFDLADYLAPNFYDWRLKEGEYSTSYQNAEVLRLTGEPDPWRYRVPKTTQIHVYANRDSVKLQDPEADWGSLFKELFRPAPVLKKELDSLDFGNYIALVFRFQNKLGDFKEYGCLPFPEEERQALIKKCVDAVKDMHVRFPDFNLLVTSDSTLFLKEVRSFNYVKIISGDRVHIDSKSENIQNDAFIKSFVDFYMISEAERVYCIGTKDMYPSEFPMYAAKLNNRHFERILIS